MRIETIAGVNAEDASNLLHLALGDAYGRSKSAALWRWKHQQNPSGSSLGLAAYADGGELVALRPFMRWRLLDAAGSPIAAVRAVDTVVHPSCRRSGLFSRLTLQALEDLSAASVDLVFNTPNDQSGPGYRKMGWALLGHPTVWVCMRPGVGRRAEPRTGEEPGMRLPDAWPEFSESPLGVPGGMDVAMAQPGMRVLKDQPFLKWRYAQHPNLKYRMVPGVGVDRGGDCVAVVREDRRRGRVGLAIADVFQRPGHSDGLRSVWGIIFRETGDYVVTRSRGGFREGLALIKSGFIPLPWRNVNLAARAVRMPASAPVFRSQRHWQLSLGDLETF